MIYLYIGSCNNKFLLHGFYSRYGFFSPFFRLRNPDRLCRVAAHLHKVEPVSTFEAHEAHEAHKAHNAGCSSAPVYIEIEWQLAAQDAFGVSPRLHCTAETSEESDVTYLNLFHESSTVNRGGY